MTFSVSGVSGDSAFHRDHAQKKKQKKQKKRVLCGNLSEKQRAKVLKQVKVLRNSSSEQC